MSTMEFFDDVAIPVENLVGQLDDGWTVVTRLLAHERGAVGGSSPYVVGSAEHDGSGSEIDLHALARQVGRGDDPLARQLVGEAAMRGRVHDALVERVARAMELGRLPGPAGSILRLSSGMNAVRRSAIELELAGDRAVAWDGDDLGGRVGPYWLARQGSCLGGGSTEMARNLIAERVLGMPRERAEDADRPFREVRTNQSARRTSAPPT